MRLRALFRVRRGLRSRLFLTLTLLALLVIVTVLKRPDDTRFWSGLFDLGHVPLLGTAALVIRRLMHSSGDPRQDGWSSVRAFAVTLALGAGIELVQLYEPGRSASVADVLRGAAGAAAFLLLRSALGARVRGPRLRGAMAWCAVLLLVTASAQFAWLVASYAARARAFPVLFRLDGSWWEETFVETGQADLSPRALPATSTSQGPLARLDLHPALYSGLSLDEPYPDWTGFDRLVFTVASEQDVRLTLNIRIHDAWHANRYEDRFNGQFVVTQGSTQVEIPLDDVRRGPKRRALDLRHVRGIVIFAFRPQPAASVFLGPFRLERGRSASPKFVRDEFRRRPLPGRGSTARVGPWPFVTRATR